MSFKLRRRTLPALSATLMALLFAGCHRAATVVRDPESAANQFFSLAESGKCNDAFNAAAFAFRARQTFQAFAFNALEIGLPGGRPPVWDTRQVSPTEARLAGTFTNAYGFPVRFAATLIPADHTWRLFSLNINTGPRDGYYKLFTSLGHGDRFEDVYHQPMPNVPALDTLVHTTLGDFNAAIQTGDFHHFYQETASVWKAADPRSGGLTQKVLEHHFNKYVQGKPDLLPLADRPLVFEQVPIINHHGLLDVRVHFIAGSLSARFHLDYVYECPRWRLCGIDFDLDRADPTATSALTPPSALHDSTRIAAMR